MDKRFRFKYKTRILIFFGAQGLQNKTPYKVRLIYQRIINLLFKN